MSNFSILWVGKYKRLIFTVLDADTSQPQDITGATFKFTIKRSRLQDPDYAALVLKTSASGITITDALNGAGRIDISPGDTSALPLVDQPADYDLQIIRGSNPEIIASGNCFIKVPVTRAAS